MKGVAMWRFHGRKRTMQTDGEGGVGTLLA